jgi:hypothetical protein
VLNAVALKAGGVAAALQGLSTEVRSNRGRRSHADAALVYFISTWYSVRNILRGGWMTPRPIRE